MRAKLVVVFLAACGVLGVLSAAPAIAAPGALDPSFGQAGVVVFPTDLGFCKSPVGEAMAVGPRDEIFVLQRENDCSFYPSPCRSRVTLQRFLPDGQVDSGFGLGGTVVVPGEPAPEQDALAVSPQGEPVVAEVLGNDISLVRFTATGSLDSSFGGDGAVTRDYGGQENHPRIAVAPNGDVILGASSTSSSGSQSVIVARYLPTGELSPGFGAGTGETGGPGWLAIPAGLIPGALDLSNAGQIVLAGTPCCSAGTPFTIFESRRRANGRLLSGLTSAMPWKRVKVGEGASVGSVIALPNGKVYLVGTSSGSTFAVKLRANGKLERHYGHRGIVRIKAMDGASNRPAVVDDAGRLVVAGRKGIPGGEFAASGDLLVARRLPGGGRDRSFGNRSVVDLASFGLGRIVNAPISLGIQSTGRIVIFGEVRGACFRACPVPPRALLRLYGGSAKRPHHRQHR
ncbi:MAG: hypothetical protein ACTHNY_00740 [Solirubrobacterales bacterium]